MDYHYFICINEYLSCRGSDTQKDFIIDNDLLLKCVILENDFEKNKTITFKVVEIINNCNNYTIEIGNIKKIYIEQKIQNNNEIQYNIDIFSYPVGNFDFAYLISSNLYSRIKLEYKYESLINEHDKITCSNNDEKKFIVDLLNNKISELIKMNI